MTSVDTQNLHSTPTLALNLVPTNKSGADTMQSPQKDWTNKDQTLRQSGIRSSDKSFSIAKNVTEIKERRKLMESNAQLLLNRLQALAHEEYKMKKNAHDLKKRAQELLQHRLEREKQKNVDDQNQNKEKVKVNESNQMQDNVAKIRAKNQAEMARIREMIADQRRKEAQAIREQRVLHEEQIKQAQLEHLDKQKMKSIKVKNQEEVALKKVKEYHLVKEELMREKREREVREEEERILQKEREVQKLMMEEDMRLELINKAETDEIKAIQEYDDISKLPVDDLASKYSYYLKHQSKTPKVKSSANNLSLLNNRSGANLKAVNQTMPNENTAQPWQSFQGLKNSHLSP